MKRFILVFILLVIFISGNSIIGISGQISENKIGYETISGISFNSEEFYIFSPYYNLYDIVKIVNIENNKETYGIVIDNSELDNRDLLLELSKRIYSELQAADIEQMPVKVEKIVSFQNFAEAKVKLNNLLGVSNKNSEEIDNTQDDSLKEIDDEKEDNDKSVDNEKDNIQDNNEIIITDTDDLNKGFYVQLGAFIKKENAVSVYNSMKQYGFDIYMIFENTNSKKFYKIIIGPFSWEKANEIKDLVRNLKFEDSFILKI